MTLVTLFQSQKYALKFIRVFIDNLRFNKNGYLKVVINAIWEVSYILPFQDSIRANLIDHISHSNANSSASKNIIIITIKRGK